MSDPRRPRLAQASTSASLLRAGCHRSVHGRDQTTRMQERSDSFLRLPECSLDEVASLTGGERIGLPADFQVRGLATDSRSAAQGNLFVAIPGEQVDGHRFVEEVWSRGAAALVHQRPERLAGPAVLVEDTLTALQRWARRDLERRPARVVGITGSVGKTSVKEMCGAVLATGFRVHRTRQNKNGQLGVALTVLERPRDTEVLVLEMGISLPGEMDRIVAIAPPEIAVLSRLSPVHRENFPSYADLIAEKRRILLGGGGRLPRACVVHAEVLASVEPVPSPVWTYGFADDARIRATDLGLEPAARGGRPSGFFLAHGLDGRPLKVRLPFFGGAMAENALAALAVGRLLGLDPEPMIAALARLELDAPMRQEWHSAGGVTWINDAYNASPASMRSALELLQSCPGATRRIAVLGDMLELGPESDELHRELAEPVGRAADLLFTFGPRARAVAVASPVPAEAFEDIDALLARLLALLRPGDLVLLKGSRGMRLERIAEALASRFGNV
jgi:UDP-N-acetylmuramoyl-tripeptide--D-alanyl-D-alanine ligase